MRLRPHGEGEDVPPMFLSKMSIKRVVHSGLNDEVEEKSVFELREKMITENNQSITFLSKERMDVLEEGIKTDEEASEVS